MATSPLNIQPSNHSRPKSLPSSQHPITSQIDENLNGLKESQSASTSSSSISHKPNDLQDLHEYVDMLLLLPLTQQALAQKQPRKWVADILDGSLMLLNVCCTTEDVLLQTKDCTQELRSILRRKRVFEGLVNEVKYFLTSRKAVKMEIRKALKNLKHMETKLSSSSFNNGDNGAVISILKEVEAVTINVLESLLSFISGPVAESELSRWSLASKLMHQKRVTCEEEEEEEQRTNEIANAEAALRSFIKSENMKHVENVHNELQNSEFCIQDLEEGLENLFRRLIKARVNVLSILNS